MKWDEGSNQLYFSVCATELRGTEDSEDSEGPECLINPEVQRAQKAEKAL